MTPAADSLLGWLLTYWIHSTALLAGAWLVTRRLRSPGVREAVWKTALVAGIVTSAGQHLGLVPVTARYVIPSRAATPSSAPSPSRPAVVRAEPGPAIVTAPAPEPEAHRPARSLPLAVVLGWLIVAAALLFSLAASRWRLARRLGPRRAVAHPEAERELRQLVTAARFDRPVMLTTAPVLPSPIAIGLSEICVPVRALIQLAPSERRSMLAHELAHLIRLDPVWLTVAAVIERVGFFQPLNRLARREIQAEAEFLCDEWAAERIGGGLTMAKCLVTVAEWIDAAPRPIPLAGMAEERSQLVSRVQRLMEESAMSIKPRRRIVVAAGVLLTLAAIAVVPKVALEGQDPKPRPARVVGSTPTPVVAGARTPAPPRVPPAALAPGMLGVRAPMVAMAGPGRGRQADTTGAVVPALVGALKDPAPEVRRAAAQSLGSIGDRRATTGLIGAVDDEQPAVRAAVVEALGQLEDPKAIDALAGRLKDPVREVRRAAFEALSHFEEGISPELFRPWLADADPEIRAATAEVLGRLEDHGSTAALVRLLGDEKPEVRQAALSALGNLELKETPAGVIGALTDADAEVRAAAANLVGSIGDRRAVPALRTMLADRVPEVRESAVNALSSIRDQAAIDALVTALKSSDPVVRKAAAEALGQR